MERNVRRLIEHFREALKISGGLFDESMEKETITNFHQIQTKALYDLKTDEQALKPQLENLKKENFSLEISISAWTATQEQKQNELKEAESKLNEIYNEIWSEREEFCSKADEFNKRFGILSKWWEEKMDEFFNPIIGKDEEMYQAKIQDLEKEIDELQKEIQNLEEKKAKVCEVKQDENFNKDSNDQEASGRKNPMVENEPPNELTRTIQRNEEPAKEEIPEASTFEIIKDTPKKKKVRFSEEYNEITIYNENADLKSKFFSILDKETVRKANRIKNKQKNQFLSKVRKIT